VDYSRIRFQGNRYRVDDLERFLIVPERNEAILNEYLTKGNGDKAIGFCVSVRHAERMAELFQSRGILAAAVTSQTPNRDFLISEFRRNQLNVVFTVDLFNEGMDFPNVRVLLFLRPTESKTVFTQQLGRGLRLCTGKERVRILDFIGNYKRANQIRKWLAKAETTSVQGTGATRRKKIEYTYSIGCAVHFDPTVAEILDSQDEREMDITKDDLKEAYFALAETLGRKPTREELNNAGKYKSAAYLSVFGSWINFLREIGEYTEASYHYPQGVHIGHLLSILKTFAGRRSRTHFDDQYIRLRGELGEGRISSYRRQVKYKLLAAMELGILPDDRTFGPDEEVKLELTSLGQDLHTALHPLLDTLDLRFEVGDDGIPSSQMTLGPREYNTKIREFCAANSAAQRIYRKIFLGMPAVQQMLLYFYQITRVRTVERATVYRQFFATPFVKQFCDQEGIEEATQTGAEHRCPFLINVLDSCGFISQTSNEITVEKLLITGATVRAQGDTLEEAQARAERLWNHLKHGAALPDRDAGLLRELFGRDFLTASYYLKDVEYSEI
jgi:Helicase conserved C-terminal domain/Homing endonuclease associated repeat